MEKLMTYRVDTAMGTVSTFFGHPLDFLTKEQKDEFDNIGYTGKTFRGDKVSRIDYLNSLELGMFSIEYIKRGNGDFKESFVISRSFNDNESHIQFCVAYAISERKGKISNHFENFEDEEAAKKFYKSLLEAPNLYTANLCKVIETTD